MKEKFAEAWYVDAIDHKAGRAFASFRDTPLVEAITVTDFQSPIFICAPDFSIESLMGSSSASAASRMSFQSGFYGADESEVAFPTPTAIAEFVRRAYIAGNGDDGDSDGVDPDTPEGGPSGEMPDLPKLLEGMTAEDQISGQLLSQVLHFQMQIEQTPSPMLEEQFAKFQLPLPRKITEKKQIRYSEVNYFRDLLMDAALILYQQFDDMLPNPDSITDLSDLEFQFYDFVAVCHYLGLWPGLLDRLDSDVLVRLSPFYYRARLRSHGNEEIDFARMLSSLERLQTPAIKGFSAGQRKSLLSLLNTFCAVPQSLLSAPPQAHRPLIALVYFAAALICGPAVLAPNLVPDSKRRIYKVGEIAYLDLLKRCQTWLTNQLPKQSFSNDVEQALMSAAGGVAA